MNARPHWQEFIKPYGRIALLNMSIHHLDVFRYLFGDPERILVLGRGPIRAMTSRTRTGWPSTSSSTTTASAPSAIDNCFTWVDHRIEWRVEGTEGVAKGTIGWPDYPDGQPVDDRLDDARRWTARWEAAALGGALVPAGVQGHDGPADARDPGRRGAGDLRARTTLGTMALVEAAYRSFREEGRAVSPRRRCWDEAGRDLSIGPFSLEGRVAFVTGAGGGLGEGICTSLAAAGAAVACADVDSDRAAADRAAASTEQGGRALAAAGGRRRSAVGATRASTGRSPSSAAIDVLVNNAAIYPRRAWTEITEEEWDRVLAVNLKGYFLCARACYPSMKERGRGRIVNVSSITFLVGFEMLLDYVSSKGGIVGFTRALAHEVGPEGTTVNAIAPGAFPTDAEKIHPDPGGLQPVGARPAVHQAPRHARGHRQPRRLPLQRRIVVHHRTDRRHRRRLGDALAAWSCRRSRARSQSSPAPGTALERRSPSHSRRPGRRSP